MASNATLMRIKQSFTKAGEQFLSEKEIVRISGISRPTFLNVVNKSDYLRKKDAYAVGINTGVQYVYEWAGLDIGVPAPSAQKPSSAEINLFLENVKANPQSLMAQIYNAIDSKEKGKVIIAGLMTCIAAIRVKFD